MPDEPSEGYRTYFLHPEGSSAPLTFAGQRTKGEGADLNPATSPSETANILIWKDPPKEVTPDVKDIEVRQRRPGPWGWFLPRKMRARVNLMEREMAVPLNARQVVSLFNIMVKERLIESEMLDETRFLLQSYRTASGASDMGVPGGHASETDGARA